MSFEEMVSSGLLRKEEISPKQIDQTIKRASKDLENVSYL
jgi:hypothetical protein